MDSPPSQTSIYISTVHTKQQLCVPTREHGNENGRVCWFPFRWFPCSAWEPAVDPPVYSGVTFIFMASSKAARNEDSSAIPFPAISKAVP